MSTPPDPNLMPPLELPEDFVLLRRRSVATDDTYGPRPPATPPARRTTPPATVDPDPVTPPIVPHHNPWPVAIALIAAAAIIGIALIAAANHFERKPAVEDKAAAADTDPTWTPWDPRGRTENGCKRIRVPTPNAVLRENTFEICDPFGGQPVCMKEESAGDWEVADNATPVTDGSACLVEREIPSVKDKNKKEKVKAVDTDLAVWWRAVDAKGDPIPSTDYDFLLGSKEQQDVPGHLGVTVRCICESDHACESTATQVAAK